MVKIGVLLPKLSKKISQGSHLFWTTRYIYDSYVFSDHIHMPQKLSSATNIILVFLFSGLFSKDNSRFGRVAWRSLKQERLGIAGARFYTKTLHLRLTRPGVFKLPDGITGKVADAAELFIFASTHATELAGDFVTHVCTCSNYALK